jgi:hypothetical protein
VTIQGEDRSDEDLNLTIAVLPLKIIVLIGMDEPSYVKNRSCCPSRRTKRPRLQRTKNRFHKFRDLKMCGEPVSITKSRLHSDQKCDVALPVIIPIPSCETDEAA